MYFCASRFYAVSLKEGTWEPSICIYLCNLYVEFTIRDRLGTVVKLLGSIVTGENELLLILHSYNKEKHSTIQKNTNKYQKNQLNR